MVRIAAYILVAIFMVSCHPEERSSDAYGNFEARELLVPAKTSGILKELNVEEGMVLEKGKFAGYIDTSRLYLQKAQLKEQLEAVESQVAGVTAQIEVQKQQLENLKVEQQRIKNLLEKEAATPRQMDQINGKVRVARKQIDVSRSKYASLYEEMDVIRRQIEGAQLQLEDARIINPLHGTVLEKYVREHEMVRPGSNLYKIADLRFLELRVYVSGAQLPGIDIGQSVQVFIDKNENELQELQGTVSWIAHSAEFTPKVIQTREERVDLVYAIKVKVRNDGRIKIGMPGEVKF